ncbi:hypothetical protein RND71_021110 [Anisodus tanguticus]|uniref:thymidine kinase n=1 Tax=Anisodus tanguticus TaxID=243964 RepID=A0AAE1RXQ7_9SOLA|nr:hypothetical protein RND71_021110 [Anisodus tanguticus]
MSFLSKIDPRSFCRVGEIHVIVGPMFAGKTTALLRRVNLESNDGRNVVMIKSSKDTRYAVDAVVTHDGTKFPCWSLPDLSSFKHRFGVDAYEKVDVIGIDEAQFFGDLYEFCCNAADLDGKTVIVAGLDGDYLRKSFGSVLDIIPLADTVTKLTARCELCSRKAFFTFRKTREIETELIGGADMYMPVCRQHYVNGQTVKEAAKMVLESHEVVGAAARSLKFIYQSKLAPRYDFLQGNNMEFIQSLLNSENENVTGLGASIITHSCQTSMEQKALSDAGVIKKLTCMLGGSVTQKDASLESLATILEGNPDVISKFMEPENGGALGTVTELTKDKNARTRLLACLHMLDCHKEIFSFILIAEKEDLQVLAFEANVIDKLVNHLRNGPLLSRRLEGILIALANMCSRLERCRDRLLSLEKCVTNESKGLSVTEAFSAVEAMHQSFDIYIFFMQAMKFVTDALSQDSGEILHLKGAARCIKLPLCAGSAEGPDHKVLYNIVCRLTLHFCRRLFPRLEPMTFWSHGSNFTGYSKAPLQIDTASNDLKIFVPLLVSALDAISNIVVDFLAHKTMFIQCGGVKQLVQLSKPMDLTIRVKAVCALRNLTFLVNDKCKEEILSELTQLTLRSLICGNFSDIICYLEYPEACVQELALALVRNLVICLSLSKRWIRERKRRWFTG